ncbi:hypothetical protein X777_07840 [Ooceraea biroi]|uniref:Uncharacterized protein n=1 Tax=Ooceraea biroi TaxID=2015173 RepID=A0A026WZP6_OOCBI|nr:hypothetical protein X777_07840 [Ooceraea biroi]
MMMMKNEVLWRIDRENAVRCGEEGKIKRGEEDERSGPRGVSGGLVAVAARV